MGRRGGCAGAMVLAAGLLAAAPAAAEADCDALIRGRLYPPSLTRADSAAWPRYRDWLCTRRFDTHNQALAAGLAAGAAVYGIPLAPGRSFGPRDRDAWRLTHCPSDLAPGAVEAAESAFRALADAEVLEDYLACRSDGDLDCEATVTGDFAIFHARYGVVNRTTSIETLRVNGKPVRGRGWEPGAVLDGRGRSYAHALVPETDELVFELETRLDRCRASIEKHTIRKQTNSYPRGPRGARRRPH